MAAEDPVERDIKLFREAVGSPQTFTVDWDLLSTVGIIGFTLVRRGNVLELTPVYGK